MKQAIEPFADRYIDLHLHLDGAITPEIAAELARIRGISLPEDRAELERLLTVQKDCRDLNEFLARFELPISLLQTPGAIEAAVRLVSERIRSQGVVYAEIRFAPQSHTRNGMTQEDAVRAALRGLAETDLKANLILCCMRGRGNERQNLETVELAGKYLVRDGGVTAIDLAGAEALFPTRDYRGLFAAAREAGIPYTIHAGEADGPESVRAALSFGAKRIGHGVRCAADPETVRLIKESGAALEMCPTSNRQTHAVDDMAAYPFMDLLRQGVKVTLNTDDAGIEGISLADEYRYMEREFHLTAAQEKIILANAVSAAFTTDEVKASLRTALGLEQAAGLPRENSAD